MDNDSTDRLKFDKRLANRRGWVPADELEELIASLPDAADKVYVPSEEAAVSPSDAASGSTPGGMPGA